MFTCTPKKLPPLHEAVENNDIKAAEKCNLSSHCLNRWDADDQLTPLNLAVSKGYVEMVRFLIKNGANVNARAGCGKTPLHFAAECPHSLEIAQILLESPDINLDVKIAINNFNENVARYLTLDEYALSHRNPILAEMIDEKRQQERLNSAAALYTELKEVKDELKELKNDMRSLKGKFKFTASDSEKENSPNPLFRK